MLSVLLASALQSSAQSPVYLGVQGGIGIPDLHSSSNGPEISRGYSSRMGPYFGLLAEFAISDRFSIQPEVNYSAQGGVKKGNETFRIDARTINPQAPAGSYIYVDAHYKNEAILNYLEVPVLAKFSFPLGNDFYFTIDAGPYAGFLMRAKNKTTGHAKAYLDEQKTQPMPGGERPIDSTTDIKDQLHTLNFGLQGGVGLSYHIGNGNIFLHAGGNYGFVKIQKDKQNGEDNTGAATVTIGYALKLN